MSSSKFTDQNLPEDASLQRAFFEVHGLKPPRRRPQIVQNGCLKRLNPRSQRHLKRLNARSLRLRLVQELGLQPKPLKNQKNRFFGGFWGRAKILPKSTNVAPKTVPECDCFPDVCWTSVLIDSGRVSGPKINVSRLENIKFQKSLNTRSRRILGTIFARFSGSKTKHSMQRACIQL